MIRSFEVNGITWLLLHPKAVQETLGYVPNFLVRESRRSAIDQFIDHQPGGWCPMEGFSFNPKTYELTYPGDPPFMAIAATVHNGEEIIFYRNAWVVVFRQKDGTFEVAKLD